MTNRQKRAIIILVGSVAFLVALYFMARPMIDMVGNPDEIKTYIENTGFRGLVVFSFMNMMQVLIAFIPGGPFSFAAGYIWGVWLGTLICIVSTSIMSVAVFLLVRRFGRGFVDLFIPESESRKFNKLLRSDRARQLLFVIYLVPASPKDPLAYLAGLTDITVLDWAIINLIGRFPGTFITALGAKSVEEGNLILAGAIFLAAVALYLVGRHYYNKKIKKEAEEE